VKGDHCDGLPTAVARATRWLPLGNFDARNCTQAWHHVIGNCLKVFPNRTLPFEALLIDRLVLFQKRLSLQRQQRDFSILRLSVLKSR
jgi:hypothetical protein